jgi:hypothetical protein
VPAREVCVRLLGEPSLTVSERTKLLDLWNEINGTSS